MIESNPSHGTKRQALIWILRGENFVIMMERTSVHSTLSRPQPRCGMASLSISLHTLLLRHIGTTWLGAILALLGLVPYWHYLVRCHIGTTWPLTSYVPYKLYYLVMCHSGTTWPLLLYVSWWHHLALRRLNSKILELIMPSAFLRLEVRKFCNRPSLAAG